MHFALPLLSVLLLEVNFVTTNTHSHQLINDHGRRVLVLSEGAHT